MGDKITDISQKWKKAQRLGSSNNVRKLKQNEKLVPLDNMDVLQKERKNILNQFMSQHPTAPSALIASFIDEIPDEVVQAFVDDGGFSLDEFLANILGERTVEDEFKENFIEIVEDVSEHLLEEILDTVFNKKIDVLSDILKVDESAERSAKIAGAILNYGESLLPENITKELDGKLTVRVTVEVIPDDNFIDSIDKLQEVANGKDEK